MGLADICKQLKNVTNSNIVEHGEVVSPDSNKAKKTSEKESRESNTGRKRSSRFSFWVQEGGTIRIVPTVLHSASVQ